MIDKVTSVASLLVIGAISVRIVTNPKSAGTISAIMKGFAGDITAAVGK